MTSQLESPVRKRRGRVVLLGEGPRFAELAFTLAAEGVRVKNAYEAIGEIASAPAQRPIEAVILGESSVLGISEHPAIAVRRIDPSVRIFLVQDATGEGGPPQIDRRLDEEFDAVLQDWPSAEQLDRLLGRSDRTVIARPPRTGDPGGALDSEPALTVEIPQRNQPNGMTDRESGGARSESVGAGGSGREPRAESRQPNTESTASPKEEVWLGDVDLVEAVLQGEGKLRERALRLLRQHTQWKEITLVEEADDSEAGVEVQHEQQSFGRLHVPDVPNEELKQWADWLGKWLALDANHRQFCEWSFHDELTGAWNRRYFKRFLQDSIKYAVSKRIPVTVMVFDLDNFKRYNDEYGHAAGDEILCETVRLLNSVIRKSDRVCRIGGDEFAVVFTDPGGPREKGSMPPESIEQIAQRFQDQVCQMKFPKLGIEAPGTLSVSAGLATFPWDGWDPEDLVKKADAYALQSKRKGKNAITLGPGAEAECAADQHREPGTPSSA